MMWGLLPHYPSVTMNAAAQEGLTVRRIGDDQKKYSLLA
jgi:hypothetical protein